MGTVIRLPTLCIFNVAALLMTLLAAYGFGLAAGFRMPGSFEQLSGQLLFTFGGSVAFAYLMWRGDQRGARMALIVPLSSWFTLAGGMLSYVMAAANLPLRDELFASIDAHLGVDWVSLVTWGAEQEWLCRWASVVYGSCFIYLMIGTVSWLILSAQCDQLEKLLAGVMIAGLLCITIGALLPALSAFSHHHIDIAVERRLHTAVGHANALHFFAVRNGVFRDLTSELQGIVAFPSFHSTLAVLFPWALRRHVWLAAPGGALGAVIIATTPFIGGHYVTDIIGGLAVALTAIIAVNKLSAVTLELPLRTRRVPQLTVRVPTL